MTGGPGPLLLTERDWQWWFGVGGPEAARLVHVQRALVETGIDPCPETVLGMSRTVLIDDFAPARLRTLADVWDRVSAPPADADADVAWPMEGHALASLDGWHLQAGRAGQLLSHRCPRRSGRRDR